MLKNIIILIMLCCNAVLGQMSLIVNGNEDSASEISANADGEIVLGVVLDAAYQCSVYNIKINVTSGVLDASEYTSEYVFDLPTQFVYGDDESLVSDEIRFAGAMLGRPGPEGPQSLIGNILYSFENTYGDVTIALIATDSGTVFNGTGIEEDTVLDTLVIHHPEAVEPEGDPVDFTCLTFGAYSGKGTVDYPTAVYANSTITLTAEPQEGYRVSRWFGTDSTAATTEQTVTIGTRAKRVMVSFEPIPTEKVTTAFLRAGLSRTPGSVADSFMIAGTLAAGADDLPESDGTVTVSFASEYMAEPYTASFSYGDTGAKVIWPTLITYVNRTPADGKLSMFRYITSNGSFVINATGQDLTGWTSPLTMTISIGDYSKSFVLADAADVAEDDTLTDVINGRADMPFAFLVGAVDKSIVDRNLAVPNRITGLTSGALVGRIATEADPSAITGVTISKGDWSSSVLPLTKARFGNTYTYTRPRSGYEEDDYIISASFRMDTAALIIRYANADFDDESDFEFEFSY